MDRSSHLAVHLEAMERELHDASVRKSSRLAELLADDFVEFGSSGGIFNKAQILQELGAEPGEQITSSGYKVTALSIDIALVTYVSARGSSPAVQVLRSSIWRRHGEARNWFFIRVRRLESPQAFKEKWCFRSPVWLGGCEGVAGGLWGLPLCCGSPLNFKIC